MRTILAEEPKTSKGRATLSENKSGRKESESTNGKPEEEEIALTGSEIKVGTDTIADGMLESPTGKPGGLENATTGPENKTRARLSSNAEPENKD